SMNRRKVEPTVAPGFLVARGRFLGFFFPTFIGNHGRCCPFLSFNFIVGRKLGCCWFFVHCLGAKKRDFSDNTPGSALLFGCGGTLGRALWCFILGSGALRLLLSRQCGRSTRRSFFAPSSKPVGAHAKNNEGCSKDGCRSRFALRRQHRLGTFHPPSFTNRTMLSCQSRLVNSRSQIGGSCPCCCASCLTTTQSH